MIRIGVDVGGTFTDAVVIRAQNHEIIAVSKVLTTHDHPSGVSHGIAQALLAVLKEADINPKDVRFIAQGTTQATNALLEGDVAIVGIISIGEGFSSRQIRKETQFSSLKLSEQKSVPVHSVFLQASQSSADVIIETIHELAEKGVTSIVAATAYSVDDPCEEKKIAQEVKKAGLFATCSHEMSGMYGLRTRTRTALLNASILPRMVQSIEEMRQQVQETGIQEDLMIMRSDGGVMSAEEVLNRPIETFLSGPAAGVSGALIYGKVSQGLFCEVGGTSTDISLINRSMVKIQWARVGRHRTYLPSLDIRTLALGGGSMLRLNNDKVECGPRSAHIAGLPYICFSEPLDPDHLAITTLNDEEPYFVLDDVSNNNRFAFTLTCMEKIGENKNALLAFELLGKHLGKSVNQLVDEVRGYIQGMVEPVLDSLCDEEGVDINLLTLYGGGGGSDSILEALSKRIHLPYEKLPNAEILSTIGVALAMVKEVAERMAISLGDDELTQLRQEAKNKALRAGAHPDTIEVYIENDPTKNLFRAIATGATSSQLVKEVGTLLPEEQILEIAKKLEPKAIITKSLSSRYYHVFEMESQKAGFFAGLFKLKRRTVVVLGADGQLRLHFDKGRIMALNKENFQPQFDRMIERFSAHTDIGVRIPESFLILDDRIIDYSMIRSQEQLSVMSNLEVKTSQAKEVIVVIKEK